MRSLMACDRCHSPRNVGLPAIGWMVVRIAVIASVVYLAIIVGGFGWDLVLLPFGSTDPVCIIIYNY